MSGRGRGRGINNAPAWLSRRGGEDAFGRAPRGDRNGPPDMHPPPMDRFPPPHHNRGPPPPRGHRYDDRGRYNDRHHHNRGPPPESRGRGGPPRGRPKGNENNFVITFRSYDEERDWVEDRRRKRLARKTKFDVPPTPEQMATDAAVLALSNPAATDFAGIPPDRNFSAVPQQTRHARRLYIGHLPPNVTEGELHNFFRSSIERALVAPTADNEDDPILSVYINHERRFCFLEFKTVEMATACLALDGIDIHGKGKVKVKRPNDYNPAMAPKVHPSVIPQLDVSKLGIISGTVQDGPNKIFIGGLHYHLTEEQVIELLQAFGSIKAFHLVKQDADAPTSKGYCFVEYADPAATPVAVLGLNGMDLGGGKVLTARVAGERSGAVMSAPAASMAAAAVAAAVVAPPGVMPTQPSTNGAPPTGGTIVNGYDIEELVDAAMGLKPMPTAPLHVDQFGVPITRVNPTPVNPMMTVPVPQPQVPVLQPVPQLPPPVPQPGAVALPPGSSALDIANAALDAAFGMGNAAPPPPPPQQQPAANPTRILVLLNMVTDEDLATDDEYQGLVDEVQGECAKYGKLLGMKVPRAPSDIIDPTAIKKIFLEYATSQDAVNAERELAGRQFGPNVVMASYFPESDYLEGKLK